MEKYVNSYSMIVTVLLVVHIVPTNSIAAKEQQTTQNSFHRIPIANRILRDARQLGFPDYSTLIDSHLPIEINVPDTATMFWQSAQSAWTSFSEYFVEDDQQVPAVFIY